MSRVRHLEQKLSGLFVGGLHVIIDGLASLLTHFKTNRPAGLLLPDGCAIRRVAGGSNIIDSHGNNITAAKLAVDRQIEHGEVASAAFDLEFGPDRPDVSGSQRWLCPGQPSLVPRQSLIRRGVCDYWILHDHP